MLTIWSSSMFKKAFTVKCANLDENMRNRIIKKLHYKNIPFTQNFIFNNHFDFIAYNDLKKAIEVFDKYKINYVVEVYKNCM